MSYTEIFLTLFGIVNAALGWFAKELWGTLKSLQKELTDFKESVAKDYVPRNDFKELASDLRHMFQIISDKLEDG